MRRSSRLPGWQWHVSDLRHKTRPSFLCRESEALSVFLRLGTFAPMTCTATFDVTSGALGEPAMCSAVGAAVASEAWRGRHRTATPR